MLAFRTRRSLESAASAIRFGIAPPRPNPVRNLAAINNGMSGINAVSSEKQPNAPIDAASTALRPN
ncbi:MAG: hypothetical protein NVS9B2_12300 [Steroidobacteraceae bacterium]